MTPSVRIRPLRPADRPRVEQIVALTSQHNPQEIATALGRVDRALGEGAEGDFAFDVAEAGRGAGVVEGYACYGSAPLAPGVYELYWIAVDPSAQGWGVGSRLLEHVEREVARRGGRRILVGISPKGSHAPTVRFYEKTGYRREVHPPGYFRGEEGGLVLAKELPPAGR